MLWKLFKYFALDTPKEEHLVFNLGPLASLGIALAPTLVNLIGGKQASDRANKQQRRALDAAGENAAAEEERFQQLLALLMEDREFAQSLFEQMNQPLGGEFGETLRGRVPLSGLSLGLSARQPVPLINPGSDQSAALLAQFAGQSQLGANSAFQAAFNDIFGTGANDGVIDLISKWFGDRQNRSTGSDILGSAGVGPGSVTTAPTDPIGQSIAPQIPDEQAIIDLLGAL